MMPFKRGQVLLALFPDSNQRTAKKRPVLAVQADQLDAGLSQTVVAMITSNMARAGHPSRVVVQRSSPEGQATGLIADSVIMTDNLATLLDTEIDRVLGSYPDLFAINAALSNTFGL